MEFDALLLSRLRFAFVIAFHILFPAFTIGLAAFLAVCEGLPAGEPGAGGPPPRRALRDRERPSG